MKRSVSSTIHRAPVFTYVGDQDLLRSTAARALRQWRKLRGTTLQDVHFGAIAVHKNATGHRYELLDSDRRLLASMSTYCL